MLNKFYKRAQRNLAKSKARDKEMKERGVIIYSVFDNFSFHQFFVITAESKAFEYLIMIIIILNAICCTYSAEYQVKHNGEDLDLLNIFEICIYSLSSTNLFEIYIACLMKYSISSFGHRHFLF